VRLGLLAAGQPRALQQGQGLGDVLLDQQEDRLRLIAFRQTTQMRCEWFVLRIDVLQLSNSFKFAGTKV